ncbi:N-acetylgalactosamine kinase [Nowakowskiella sp. JEL0407]|nr:N-acetylgalactosamine kinase [Nowakowskiella sp. JEL0407]
MAIPQNKVSQLSASQRMKVSNLAALFSEKFNKSPELVIRAPGRVNIIGEHIDYSGFGVLPMAIDHDILIAVSKTEDEYVSVFNVEESYKPVRFTKNIQNLEISESGWERYLQSSYKCALSLLPADLQPVGYQALVSGTIPPGAGLSSSAALVVSMVLTTAVMNNIPISQSELIRLGIKSEHDVGVLCGGMDQSISVLGLQSHLLNIEFSPPSTTPVSLPDSATFVIANTKVVSDKHTIAPMQYNLRVCEMRIGCFLIAKYLRIRIDEPVTLKRVWAISGLSRVEFENVIRTAVDVGGYDEESVVRLLGKDVFENCKNGMEVKPVNGKFKVYDRCIHVMRESERVEKFIGVCKEWELNKATQDEIMVLKDLGELMNQSHESLDLLFECSHSRLNELCALSRIQAGCFGSRLTGAGWGGSTVSLLQPEMVETFVKNVAESYYEKYGLVPEIFVSKATGGACIINL